jgi:isoleucyl-tRNA synthetase
VVRCIDMDELVNKTDIAKREEETLAFWKEQGIFEKSLEQTKSGKEFVFYDGPPFATGLPHYGHLLAGTIKDVIPRYQTMRGRYVRRVWGWDCHGLPIENLIESELGLGHKKDIEAYGLEKFNEAARASVLRYDAEWKKTIPRLGRWVDMDHEYKTMDANYSESIWWAFKSLHEKGLIFQGFKSMQVCPRCETTLSNNEVADGYKDVTDISVTAKFALIDEPKTFILAWTTTPWTLPGNVALAINEGAEYAYVGVGDEQFIVAAARVEKVFEGKEYKVLKTISGSDLVGRSYTPIFDYYAKNTTLENHANGWKVYAGSFVTLDSGTGVVHIAPAFGEDDMKLGKEAKLPFVQHVGMDGIMKPEVRDFAGVPVKVKGDTQSTDILIIKYLAGAGALFSKEKLIHSYPHCYRCDTPLLNYAAESWFVNAPALKEKLLAAKDTTEWVPENIRDGRFGKWIENTRDWAISRSRYWGAPIPVWTCSSCGVREVIGSREELASKTKKSGNTYLVMRHGEAESNVRGVVSSKLEGSEAFGLTEKGNTQAEKTALELKDKNIDIIVSSPFARTKQTAEIVAKNLGISPSDIMFDDRLKEIDTGIFNGGSVEDYRKNFTSIEEKFTKRPSEGENILDVKRRAMALLEDLEERYQGKTILIVTHEYVVWMLAAGAKGLSVAGSIKERSGSGDYIETGEVLEIPFVPFPHTADFEFDVHRPYIDRVNLPCSCGGSMVRVPYVFDCWFESGSMPYAQLHYPFENKELFEKNFPADFIAEGLDQTRGWFYSLLVLSVGLFDRAPFKNVVVNGMVLAEDGQKMSKKLKNYPDPWDMLNRYGADAIRYYMLASPIVRAEALAFSERGVDEVVKKHISRTLNVLSFYEMYGGKGEAVEGESNNVLDQWILARLAQVLDETTKGFDAYEIDRAVKPVALFVDDLSTWYLRRSRDRFKSDDALDRAHAIATTRTVLREFAKLIAPTMPFLAEYLYQRLQGQKESVHLEAWSVPGKINQELLDSMAEVRHTVSLALEARVKAGMKVRQPLGKLSVKSQSLKGKSEFLELIKDEVNVKEVVCDDSISEDVLLDLVITPELKKEGQFRELVRGVQELRKNTGLMPSDVVVLEIKTNEEGKELVSFFMNELKKATLLSEVAFAEVSTEALDIDGIPVAIAIKK